jgi:hypothetical protein
MIQEDKIRDIDALLFKILGEGFRFEELMGK